MESLYQKLVEEKSRGRQPQWAELSDAEFRTLVVDENPPDARLAELFGVPVGKIRYRRKRLGLSQAATAFLRALRKHEIPELAQANRQARESLLFGEKSDAFLIGIAHYIFRNGPVEDLHSEGKLSEQDMATLNRYMVNRLADVVLLDKQDRWLELQVLLEFYMLYGIDWDRPRADLSELEEKVLTSFARFHSASEA